MIGAPNQQQQHLHHYSNNIVNSFRAFPKRRRQRQERTSSTIIEKWSLWGEIYERIYTIWRTQYAWILPATFYTTSEPVNLALFRRVPTYWDSRSVISAVCRLLLHECDGTNNANVFTLCQSDNKIIWWLIICNISSLLKYVTADISIQRHIYILIFYSVQTKLPHT